ncbi:hypothetical protein L596_029728 [Steinernema carpocapsae]|uniref:Uncharacterized protein n=1 Tax=Steinernema carpocapsae TaxID=34508 RepID=A0A4U5LQN2_STECR|nr:hypothetical protein L596_029728 [Steinernema carpocapsae]
MPKNTVKRQNTFTTLSSDRSENLGIINQKLKRPRDSHSNLILFAESSQQTIIVGTKRFLSDETMIEKMRFETMGHTRDNRKT